MMLLHEPRMACDFVDMMMMQPAGTTESLGDMERSALGELGNVVGSSFLNVLANHVGIVLHPSPPAVLMDMTGALLDVIAADIQLRTDRALVAEAKFKAGERSIDGMFLAVPSAGLLKTLRGNQFAA
jgi:chemotaxis protein CheC